MTKYIKLSPASTIFYSHTLKLKILKGMKVELTDNLKDNPIICRALSNGHLVVEEVEDPSDEVSDLIQKAKEMYEGGQSVKSISKAFTFDQLSQMLAFYEFTVDESDNNLSLTKVLVEQFKL